MEDKVFELHTRLRRVPPAQLFYILYRRLLEHGLRATALWVRDKVLRRIQGFSPPDISEVAPGIYVGGQHGRKALTRMRELGITALVNMREEADDTRHDVLLDHYLWLPTIDDAAPVLEDLKRGCDFIDAHAAEGHGVYIHCASGVGRAPTMAAAYLVRQGMTPEEAWEAIRRGRPFIRPTPPQYAVIEEFAHDRDAATTE